MTDDPQASVPDDIDERLLALLERYDQSLRAGDTWVDDQLTDELTQSQRLAWEAATLSLRLFADNRTRNGTAPARESTVYLPAYVGRYEIDRIVGVGGFSIVYLGRDSFTRRQAAVKIPRPHVLLSPMLRDRFVREAQAAAQLDHPHIVPIYEAGIDGDLPYIAYAYCDGSTLAEWLKKTPEPLPVRQAAELVRTLAEAVQYSHQRGILHRDITPGNVLLVPLTPSSTTGFPFVPKLSDYGLAKLIETEFEETASSVLMGTPAYMAPEQTQRGNKSSGVTVDVYGLGAILYHLLTGRAPFVRDTPWELLVALRESEPIAPHLLRPGLPRDLETVCLKCLEKDSASRYPSAGQLADDLDRFLSGRPVEARPASWTRRSWQWCRRHPASAGLIASVLGAACLLIFGLAFYAVRVQEFSDTLAERNQRLEETLSERDAALELAENRATDLRQTLYVTEMGRAAASWKRGDVRVMVNILEPYRHSADGEPDLREFAWRYLWGQHAVRELFRKGLSTPQWTVRFSPDGTQVAFAGADSIVRLVSTQDFRVLKEIPTNQGEINGVLFGPHGDWLATAGDDGTVAVWDLPSGQRRSVWPVFENKAAFQLAFREEENLLLVCGQSPDVQLLDFMTGEKRGSLAGGHTGMIEALSLSPNARMLLTCGDDRTARIWELPTRQLRHTLSGFGLAVSGGAWSADSQRFAVGSLDHQVTVSEVETGQPLAKTRLINEVNSMDITADGLILVGDAGGSVTAMHDPILPGSDWVANAHQQRWSLHQHKIMGLAPSPDGRLLATSSRDRQIGLFELHVSVPVRRRVLMEPLEPGSTHNQAGPDRQGRSYRISHEGLCMFEHDSADLHGFLLARKRFWDVLCQDDALFVTTADGELQRWDIAERPKLIETVTVVPNKALALEFLEPNRLLLHNPSFGIGVWNISRRQFERIWPEHHRMAVAPDGRQFVLARNSGYGLVFFDATTLEELWTATGHTHQITDLKFGPLGRRLYSCSDDHSIRVWDLAAKREVLQLRGHESPIDGLAVSPDEKTLASADESGSVRLWDLRTGREFFELFQHHEKFYRLDFTADGEELVGLDNGPDKLVEFRWSCRESSRTGP